MALALVMQRVFAKRLAALAVLPLAMIGCQTFQPPKVPQSGSVAAIPSSNETSAKQDTVAPSKESLALVQIAPYNVPQDNPNGSGNTPTSLGQLDVVRGQNPGSGLPATNPPANAPNGGYYPQTDAGSGGYFRNPLPPSQASPAAVTPASTTGNGYSTGTSGYTSTGGYSATANYQDPSGSNLSGVPVAGQPQTVAPFAVDPNTGVPDLSSPILPRYQPRERTAPIDVYVQEDRTGRVMLGGSVNSDLGVAGQFIVEERNFDFRRPPTSWEDVWSGRAWRGAGQNFRLELMPGNRVERYTVNWTERNLFGYLPVSLSVGGFLFTRRYRDWSEQRLGGRLMLGYELTPDLSISSELRGENVEIYDPRVSGVQELDSVLGSNELFTGRFRLAHDTRDNPYMATEGHLLELIYDQVFGDFNFPRGMVNLSNYFLLRERADGSGRHVLAHSLKLGFSGEDTPIFENFFAGGYSTMRGFSFRGASPTESGVVVGGRFQMLGSLEYVFPLTADDMLRGIAFVDYGTVEQNIELNSQNFRVSPGIGLRVMIPAMGPAPLAFDFAVPVNYADTDDRQVFSFFLGFTR